MKGSSILSPSFRPSSSGALRREVVDDPGHTQNLFDDCPQREQQIPQAEEGDDDEEQEFEFSVAFTGQESSTISADEIFHNGQIRPIYPLFGTSLLAEETNQEPRPVGLPLGRLLKEERGEASWLSSESDELEGLPPETYCVWTPNNREAASPGFRKKSNSTGSSSSNSNRWKLRNILHRSSSEGRENRLIVRREA